VRYRAFIVLLVAALLAAAPSFAEGWASAAKANTTATYTFTSNDSTGLSAGTPSDQCGSATVSWHRGNSPSVAAADLYTCPTADSLIAECTRLESFSTNASGAVKTPGQAYFKVQRTALPTAGTTARLFLFCSQSAGGGGGAGGSIQGVTAGGAGNEDTLTALYGVTDLDAYPEGPTYYVGTAAATGDYGACSSVGTGLTPTQPLCDWADIENVLKEPTTTVLRPGITLKFDCQDSFTFLTAGELSIVTTEPPGSKRVILRMEGSRPGCTWTVTQSTAPVTAMIHLTDVGGDDGGDRAGGRLVVIGGQFIGFTRTVFILDNGVDFGGVNLNFTMGVGTVVDLIRPVADSKAFCLNCRGTTIDDSMTGSWEAGSLTLIGTGEFFQTTPDATANISVFTIGSGIKVNTDNTSRMTMIGHSIRQGGGASVVKRVIGTSVVDNTNTYIALARVVLQGAEGTGGVCLLANETALRGIQFEVYESTFNNCDWGIGIGSSAVTAVPALLHRVRYSVFQPGATAAFTPTFLINQLNAGSYSAIWDITDNITNLHGGAITDYVLVKKSTTAAGGCGVAADCIRATTPALWQTQLASSGDAAAIAGYTGKLLATDTPVTTADQFGGSGIRCPDVAGLGGTPCAIPSTDASGGAADGFCDESSAPESCSRKTETATCQSTRECFVAPTNAAYTIPLHAEIWGVGSTEVKSLNLVAKKYGAR
jgi:hypothetical protein